MRKYIVILIAIFILFSVQGCASNGNKVQNGASATGQNEGKGNTVANSPVSETPVPTAAQSGNSANTVGQVAVPPSYAPGPSPKTGRKVPILYYHAVDDEIFGLEELFVKPTEFEKQMAFLQRNGYTTILFEELKDVDKYEKPVLITFDDGYENNFTKAYPVLKKYGFKATIFLAVSFLDGGSMIRKSDIPQMSDVFSIQSHTLTHPDLRNLKSDEMEKELSQSKRLIEELTGRMVTAFAYPTGYYNDTVLNITKKYYKYAVQNGGGLYTTGDSLLEMKRVYIPRYLDIKGFEQKIRTGTVK